MGGFTEDVEEPSADLVRSKEGWVFGVWEGAVFPAPKPGKRNSGARKALAKHLISRNFMMLSVLRLAQSF